MYAEPKISVVIAHVPKNEHLEESFQKCIKSIKGQYDELVLVINDGIGYGKAYNRGMKYASGSYVICVSNDTILTHGKLEQLCDPQAVTYSENAQWGCFFCLPRWILNSIGGFDPRFNLAYFEDDNYLSRLKRRNIPLRRVEGVTVEHEGGVTVKSLVSSDGELQAKNKPLFEQIEKELDEGKGIHIPL